MRASISLFISHLSRVSISLNTCFTLSRDEFYINKIDQRNNPDWHVSLQTYDCVITYQTDTRAQANVISKQTLACLPKSVVIKPTNVKLSAFNGSSIPAFGSSSLNIPTKHEMHSVQFIVIDSNSPSIIGPKTSEDLNLLKCLSNINANNDNDFRNDYVDCFVVTMSIVLER